MMLDASLLKRTQREWRDLGFYYDRDDEQKLWKLVGSREGLSCFTRALREYVADPRNQIDSEHEHYGPYSYLEVMTSPEAAFDGHAIRGPLDALRRLAQLIEAQLKSALPGAQIVIRDELGPNSPYALVLDVQQDGFDPASADPQLRFEASSIVD